jgi:sulfhydrogenase subunit alpha
MLWHRYRLEADGTIAEAKIVPPTSQNQPTIEADQRAVVSEHAELDDAALALRFEQAIRNHDPCISCATHFLESWVYTGLTPFSSVHRPTDPNCQANAA